MPFISRKVVIIGAGNVGSHVAMNLMNEQYADEIVFLDINEEAANAQVTDLRDMLTALGRHVRIRVGTYDDCADANFIIMTAGRSRKPGETRLQMLESTFAILDGIMTPIRDSGFDGILICVSNPADVVTEYFYRNLNLPRSHVFGTGTALDTVRLRRIIGRIVDVDRDQVQAIVMGEHGDSSFIPESHISIGAVPMTEYLRNHPELENKLDYQNITKMVHEAGGQIIRGKHSTEFGIGAEVAMVVSAILHHERKVMPLSVHLDGEYDQTNVSVGVPCVLGRDGIQEILELELTNKDRAALRHSCDVIRGSFSSIETPKDPEVVSDMN